MSLTPNSPLTHFAGVGEVRAKKLEKLGLFRVKTFFPTIPGITKTDAKYFPFAALLWKAGYASPPWWRSTPVLPGSAGAWTWFRSKWWTKPAPST